jgi:D-glycero-D-manno-heptose 1,7-bisphosphate phosphatase
MTGKNKAVFLDRDGVINELVYHQEAGVIDSPFTVAQFRLLPGVATAIKQLHEMDFLVILVSNQPGIAKGHLTEKTFQSIRHKMQTSLELDGARLDAEYYCLHHPEAKDERFKETCSCRKPKPGMLAQAARERNIDLSESWMVGDGLTDMQAGKAAGTRPILVGKLKCELCHMMDEIDARPLAVVSALPEAAEFICHSDTSAEGEESGIPPKTGEERNTHGQYSTVTE